MASALLWMTLPKTISSIFSLATPLRAIASSAATTAKSVAVRLESSPPRLPNGVRAPARITTSLSRMELFISRRLFRGPGQASRQATSQSVTKTALYAHQPTSRDRARCPVAAACDKNGADPRTVRQAADRQRAGDYRGGLP